jgi:hypothetical protein
MRIFITLLITIFSFSIVQSQQYPFKISSAQDVRNVNSQPGTIYQDLKRATVIFLPGEEIQAFGTAPCTAVFVNTTDQDVNKRYLLTDSGCINLTPEKSTADGFISFDFEMADENRVGNPNDDAYISQLYKIKFKVLVKGPSISLIELVQSEISLLDHAYATGWNNGLDELTFSTIAHPSNDHKKLYIRPEEMRLAPYSFKDTEKKAFAGVAYQPKANSIGGNLWGVDIKTAWDGTLTEVYRGANGSGHFDTEQSLRGVTSAPLRFDHISNSFYNQYGQPGIVQDGFKKFLDNSGTWLNKVPGGYYKDRVYNNISEGNTSIFQLSINPGVEEKTNVTLDTGILYDNLVDNNIQLINPSFVFKNLTYLQSDLNLPQFPWLDIQGINVHQLNSAELFLNLYYLDYDRTSFTYVERLIYGVYVDSQTPDAELNGATHPEYNFKGEGYNCDFLPANVNPCNRDSRFSPNQGFSNQYRAEVFNAAVDHALEVGTVSLFSETFIPVKVSLKNVGSSPAVLNAIAYPGDVPKNAMQFFKPQEVLNQFTSYSYPSLRYDSQNIHIASIDVFQEGEHRSPLEGSSGQAGDDYNRTITTNNNGGYLNLRNRNFMIGPIEVSPSEDPIDQSTFEVTINPNTTNTTYSYSIWIDYYKDFANGGYDFIPDVNANLGLGVTSELVGSGTVANGAPKTVSIDIPAYNRMFMSNGLTGESIMRVAIKSGTVIPDKNDTTGTGEVEDYLVKFMVPLEVIEEREQLRDQAKISHRQGDKTQDPVNPNADPDHATLHDSTSNPFTYGTFGGACESTGTCENIYIDTENAMEQTDGQCYDLTGENIIYLDNTNRIINSNSFSDRTISLFYKEDSSLSVQDRREILYQSGNPDGGGGDDFIIMAVEDGIPVVHARINNEVIDMTKEVLDKPESVDEWLWKHATLVLEDGLLELYYNGDKIAEHNATTTVVQHNGVATVGGSDMILNSTGFQKNLTTDNEHTYTNFGGFVDIVQVFDVAQSAQNVTILSVHNTDSTNSTTNQNYGPRETEKPEIDPEVDEPILPEFSIFPNPASDRINILVEVRRKGNLQIEIFDISGRQVYRMSREAIQTGHQYIQLENLNLSNGYYVLKIKAGDIIRSEKIIIER